jgi:hypothetical protein
MRIRRFLFLVAVFASVFGLASLVEPKRKQASHFEFSEPIVAFRTAGDESFEFIPYRVVIDGRGEWIGEPPRGSNPDIWRINIEGDRVVIFATRTPRAGVIR